MSESECAAAGCEYESGSEDGGWTSATCAVRKPCARRPGVSGSARPLGRWLSRASRRRRCATAVLIRRRSTRLHALPRRRERLPDVRGDCGRPGGRVGRPRMELLRRGRSDVPDVSGCTEMQTYSEFQDACGDPAPECAAEWSTYIECVYAEVLDVMNEDLTGAAPSNCDLSCTARSGPTRRRHVAARFLPPPRLFSAPRRRSLASPPRSLAHLVSLPCRTALSSQLARSLACPPPPLPVGCT